MSNRLSIERERLSILTDQTGNELIGVKENIDSYTLTGHLAQFEGMSGG